MSATCPTPGRSLPSRLRSSLRGRSATLVAATAATLFAGLAPTGANAFPATDSDVQLTNVFAAPIAASEPRCTPDPDGRYLYDTFETFKPAPDVLIPKSTGIPGSGTNPYSPANWPSSGDIAVASQAGAVNDLCFGFNLSPNVEPLLVRTPAFPSRRRLQDPVAAPDIQGTHVWDDGLDHDDLKSSTITMPTGFAGAPDWATLCTDAQFGSGNYADAQCPANTMAGTVFGRVTALALDGENPGIKSFLVNGGFANPTVSTITDLGYVYNLQHGPNALARLGISIKPIQDLAPAKFTVDLKLDPSGRVQATVNNAPRKAYNTRFVNTSVPTTDPNYGQLADDTSGSPTVPVTASPLYLEAVAIRAWGSKAGHPSMQQDFAEWGTDCTAPVKASVAVETYAGAQSSKDSNGVTMTGCDTLEFRPSLTVETTEKKPAVPTGVKVNLALGQNATGLKTALLKDAAVTLPAGLEIGAQVGSGASGLPLCTAAQFAKTSAVPNTCPAGSKQGTVSIITPLLSNRTLEGNVYLGEQSAVGELPPLYLEASLNGASDADAPRIKLVGSVKVDDQGHLTTTFTDAPQLRFSELRLEFPSGPNALFTTPRACGTTNGTSQITSWAKPTAPVAIQSSLVIDQDCAPVPFAPSFSMTASNTQVGASSPTKITISRPDRSPWLKDVKVTLPTGFIADLKLATECSKADAAAGSCPESSRMGTVTTVAGAGDSPLSLKGSMYLVERDEGAVAGVAIVVHAKIGELDLGNVVVPGRIDLSPTDAGLTLVTNAPVRFKGIALNLRSIVVDLDRENFPLNPTACGPLRATAQLTGDGGQTAAPTADVTYTGCADLPFEPGFEAKLSGETGPLGHPTLDVTMTPRAGDSNLKGVKVVLPQGVATDLKNLKAVCSVEAFQGGTCGDETKVGTVSASVSITNDVITGSVHLVRIEGTALPGLGLSLTGRYAVRLLSTVKIDKDKRLVTEFASIPDLPLRSVHLTVAGGAKSPLQLSSLPCTADTAWQATLAGQGGKTRQVDIPVPCAKKPVPTQTASWSAKSGLKFTLGAPTGLTIKSAKVTLPTGFKLKSGKTRTKNLKIKLTGGKAKGKYSSSSIAVVGSGAGPTKVTITLKTKGYSLPKSYKNKLKKGKTIKLKTRIVLSDGTVVTKTLSFKTK